MPDEFWSLTVREFWLKHAAFSRAEDRAESARLRQAILLGQFKQAAILQLERAANALKRYPIKPWLKSP